ncbi:TatD family hydrolase [Candidatus Acetothermia bacterium]|jgi:TatD DNase family protein|nr:TatD family hydrolase [Candidatus Acetothermia bacterium]MCI2427060.1 TatD family hydrolase [Candidatus Acetothermia bacterium]MCI2428165.1 TatD family hydrolase [Candidatus Acetothermia bacterium]
MKLIDTHAHLDMTAYRRDRAAVIMRAFTEDVSIITVGIDIDSSRAAITLAKEYRHVYATAGIHPHYAAAVDDEALIQLTKLSQVQEVVALGEIGLDYYRNLSPRNIQRDLFYEQIKIARQANLPLIIHNRKSDHDLLAILRDIGGPYRGVVHSFFGKIEFARHLFELGFYLGISGSVTFPNNKELRSLIAESPLERLLVETDAPYLTPVPFRGQRNEPSYVRYVAEEIAQIRGETVEEIARETTANAVTLFNLPQLPERDGE